MPKRDADLIIQDMLTAIRRIESYTTGHDTLPANVRLWVLCQLLGCGLGPPGRVVDLRRNFRIQDEIFGARDFPAQIQDEIFRRTLPIWSPSFL